LKGKLLITGITGMLGKSIYNYFNKFNNFEIFGFSRNKNAFINNVQFLNLNELTSNSFIFESVIHCAAEIDVNACEKNKQLAFESNVDFTQIIFSKIIAKSYFYISTDSIYDGNIGSYNENSVTNPINYYAETKLLGEKIVRKYVNNFYILRTNIYGYNSPMKNSLFEWCYKELKQGNKINGYDNMYFNPLYTGQVASLIEEIIKKKVNFGVYNIGANNIISKYDFLKKVAIKFGFNTNLINKIPYDQTNFDVKRPLNTTLVNSKIKLDLPFFDFSLDFGFQKLIGEFKNEKDEKN
jgi:dTDP-4-dehydrorhamnose reductase